MTYYLQAFEYGPLTPLTEFEFQGFCQRLESARGLGAGYSSSAWTLLMHASPSPFIVLKTKGIV